MSISTRQITMTMVGEYAPIIREIKQDVLPNEGFSYKLRYLGGKYWTLRLGIRVQT